MLLGSGAASVAAQDDDGEAPARPTLPAAALEGDEPVLAEPVPEAPPEEAARILYRIGPGMHPEWEDSAEPAADLSFVVPGDLRAQGAPAPLPQDDQTPEVRTFALSVGAGFARLLGVEPVDFVRLEQRFHARVPGMDFLYLGVGASQMFRDDGMIGGGGPRIGLGATFCGTSWIRCEGVAFVQPGFLAGDYVGVLFDLNAALELHFLFPPMLDVALGAGYSLLGNISMFHVTGMGGVVF